MNINAVKVSVGFTHSKRGMRRYILKHSSYDMDGCL